MKTVSLTLEPSTSHGHNLCVVGYLVSTAISLFLLLTLDCHLRFADYNEPTLLPPSLLHAATLMSINGHILRNHQHISTHLY